MFCSDRTLPVCTYCNFSVVTWNKIIRSVMRLRSVHSKPVFWMDNMMMKKNKFFLAKLSLTLSALCPSPPGLVFSSHSPLHGRCNNKELGRSLFYGAPVVCAWIIQHNGRVQKAAYTNPQKVSMSFVLKENERNPYAAISWWAAPIKLLAKLFIFIHVGFWVICWKQKK